MPDYVRVSTVIGLIYGPMVWADEAARDRGKRLHASVEAWANSQIYGGEVPPVEPEAQPIVDWLLAEKVELHAAEDRFVHTLGFTGQPDIMGRWKGMDVWIDMKYTESLDPRNAIQGEAYTHGTGRKGLFLQCTKAGKVIAKRHKPNAQLWAVFLNALAVCHFQLQEGIWGE